MVSSPTSKQCLKPSAIVFSREYTFTGMRSAAIVTAGWKLELTPCRIHKKMRP